MSLTPEAMELVLNQLKKLEGFREDAYSDAHGYSIGYGHFIKKGEEHLMRARLSKDQAEALLREDVSAHLTWKKFIKKDVSANQAAALTLLEYNAGAKGAVRIAQLINEGREAEAADVFLKYNKSRNSKDGQYMVLPALVKRREFERRLFLTPDSQRGTLISQTDRERKDLLTQEPNFKQASFGYMLTKDDYSSNNKTILAMLEKLRSALGVREGISDQDFREKIRREANGL